MEHVAVTGADLGKNKLRLALRLRGHKHFHNRRLARHYGCPKLALGIIVLGRVRALEISFAFRAQMKGRALRQPKRSKAQVQVRGARRNDSQSPQAAIGKLLPGTVRRRCNEHLLRHRVAQRRMVALISVGCDFGLDIRGLQHQPFDHRQRLDRPLGTKRRRSDARR